MSTPEATAKTAFLVVDTESIPDGQIVAAVKYPDEKLSPDEAIARAQTDFHDPKWNKSSFLPVTFQIPVAACVLRVGADFVLQTFACLDAPQFRPPEIVKKFWHAVSYYQAKLITFNGRGFDVPLLELAAFRYGYTLQDHYLDRNRYRGSHLDLQEFFSRTSEPTG